MKKLFETYQGVCLGDVHEEIYTSEFLHQHLDFIQQLGVKTLFMEHFYYELQTDLEAFNRGEEPSEELIKRCELADSQIAEFRKDCPPSILLPLIKAIRDREIRIVGIDSKSSSRSTFTGPYDGGRRENMNYVATKIISWEKKNDKFLAWMGMGHLTKCTIREKITFPSKSEMKELFLATYPVWGLLWERYFECKLELSLDKVAADAFKCHNDNPPSYDPGFHDKEFIETLKTKIDVVRKETIIPGVSELVRCPSIWMMSERYSRRVGQWKNCDYSFFLNEQMTLGISFFSTTSFEFIKNSGSSI